MIELTPQQQKEDFNNRVEKFKVDLKNLLDNYKVELLPIIQYAPYGIIPTLTINDKKYEKLSGSSPSGIIQPEQFTKDEKSLANNEAVVEGTAKTRKK
jgi:hypothetical protein